MAVLPYCCATQGRLLEPLLRKAARTAASSACGAGGGQDWVGGAGPSWSSLPSAPVHADAAAASSQGPAEVPTAAQCHRCCRRWWRESASSPKFRAASLSLRDGKGRDARPHFSTLTPSCYPYDAFATRERRRAGLHAWWECKRGESTEEAQPAAPPLDTALASRTGSAEASHAHRSASCRPPPPPKAAMTACIHPGPACMRREAPHCRCSRTRCRWTERCSRQPPCCCCARNVGDAGARCVLRWCCCAGARRWQALCETRAALLQKKGRRPEQNRSVAPPAGGAAGSKTFSRYR